MKDDLIQIAMRALESRRIHSAVCIGFIFFILLLFRFRTCMPEISSILGTPPIMISTGVAAICYSAGLISTYFATWLFPKIINVIRKVVIFVAQTISFLISIAKLKINERNALLSALSKLTENEKKFLVLFSQTGIHDHSNNQVLLPNMVYNAGQALTRNRILTCQKNNPSQERFTIHPKLKKKIERIVFNGSKANDSIVLDLSCVQGSQASGGGAPGG